MKNIKLPFTKGDNLIINRNGGVVARVYDTDDTDYISFIVRACNSHVVLLEACRLFEDYMNKAGTEISPVKFIKMQKKIWHKLQQAIIKIEGGQP